MTNEPQPTTHNTKHGARGKCREPMNHSRPPITQSAEPVVRVGRDQRLGLLHRAQNRTCAARWLVKYLGDMEKCDGAFMEITYWSL